MTIGERLARLVDVKSLVTLALVGVLCGMTVCGGQTSEIFDSAVMLVLGFFFGKQKNGEQTANGADKAAEMSGEKAAEKTADEKIEKKPAENISVNIAE